MLLYLRGRGRGRKIQERGNRKKRHNCIAKKEKMKTHTEE